LIIEVTGVTETTSVALAEGQGVQEIVVAGAEGRVQTENIAAVTSDGKGVDTDGATAGDTGGGEMLVEETPVEVVKPE
jgi:hypothetical protein